ncbi:MAG: hypothetical protein H7145_03095 [Akkermansiaceae bacterium]|nr:hypothetical protein [Armatimonadota bacterium]
MGLGRQVRVARRASLVVSQERFTVGDSVFVFSRGSASRPKSGDSNEASATPAPVGSAARTASPSGDALLGRIANTAGCHVTARKDGDDSPFAPPFTEPS